MSITAKAGRALKTPVFCSSVAVGVVLTVACVIGTQQPHAGARSQSAPVSASATATSPPFDDEADESVRPRRDVTKAREAADKFLAEVPTDAELRGLSKRAYFERIVRCTNLQGHRFCALAGFTTASPGTPAFAREIDKISHCTLVPGGESNVTIARRLFGRPSYAARKKEDTYRIQLALDDLATGQVHASPGLVAGCEWDLR